MNSYCHLSIGISFNGYWFLYISWRESFLNGIQTQLFPCIKKLAHFKFNTLQVFKKWSGNIKLSFLYHIYEDHLNVWMLYTKKKNWQSHLVNGSFHQGISYIFLLYCRIAMVKQTFSPLWLEIISVINAFERIQCKSWNCFTNKTVILKLILESTFIGMGYAVAQLVEALR
jgi:hypothetical protein